MAVAMMTLAVGMQVFRVIHHAPSQDVEVGATPAA